MDKVWAERFLVQEAIKERKDGTNKNKRLWDAIYKAHRDTVTGARTGNIPAYCAANRGGKNETLEALYDSIQDLKSAPLRSQELIDAIEKKQPQIEFAAIQKLVNMTLKYIIILNLFEREFHREFHIDVCEKACHCPVDSNILKELHKCRKAEQMECTAHPCWTKIGPEDYEKIQGEIETYLRKAYPNRKGNIWFDFLMWKKG